MNNYLLFRKKLFVIWTEFIYVLNRSIKIYIYSILSELGMSVFKHLVALNTLNHVNSLRLFEESLGHLWRIASSDNLCLLQKERPLNTIRMSHYFSGAILMAVSYETSSHCEGAFLFLECAPAIHVLNYSTILKFGLWLGLFD